MKEVLFIIVMLGSWLIPSAIYKVWWLFYTILIFGIVFGLFEWFAVAKTGKTVSQHFWVFSQLHPKSAWGILISMLVGWIALLGHLGSKMIWKKREEK